MKNVILSVVIMLAMVSNVWAKGAKGEDPKVPEPQKQEVKVPPPPAPPQPITKPGKYVWSNPEANRCPDYDTPVSIGRFEGIPASVREEWLKKVAKGVRTKHVFERGQEFAQMMECDYSVRKDVVVDWTPADKNKTGEKYRSYSGGYNYYLVRSEAFNRFLVMKVKAKQKSKAAAAPMPSFNPEAAIPAPGPSVTEATGFTTDNITFDDEEPAPAETVAFEGAPYEPAPTPTPAAASPYGPLKVNFDITLFGGYGEKTQGVGDGNFEGVDATFYPLHAGSFDFGLTAKYVVWQNKDFDFSKIDYAHWKGYSLTYGLAAKHRGNASEQILKVSIGDKQNKYAIDGYRNDEKTDLIVYDFYATWWFNRTFLNDVEIGLSYEDDRGGTKKSWNNNAPILNDARSDQSYKSAKLRTEFYRYSRNLALVTGLGWQKFDSGTSVRVVEGGVKANFNKNFELYAGVESKSPRGGDNSVVGVASLNIKF